MSRDKTQQRAERKDAHLKHFMEHREQGGNGFSDIILENNALPETDLDEIDTSCGFLGKQAGFPLLINAMTGGTAYAHEINRQLAMLAKSFSLPIAVGSQTIALQDPSQEASFSVVRQINESGIVIANLGANSPVEHIEKAVEMLRADAVQLHLNTAQELCMPEGDRKFRGIAENIRHAVEAASVPVIVKEVGFGISYETAKRLFESGVNFIDIGGRGGTNFAAIENRRSLVPDHFLEDWGIPTALSLLECVNISEALFIICSGGMGKSEDIVKALCAGARMTGISGILLRVLLEQGYDEAENWLGRLIDACRCRMLLLGAGSIEALRKVPFLLKGEIGELYRYKFR